MIEVLVSISIVVVMAGLTLPRYRTLQKRLHLVQNAYGLSESIRETQEMTLSGKEVGGTFPNGYGVYIERDADHYVVYADMNDNRMYNPHPDEIIRIVYFEEDVSVANIDRAGGPPGGCSPIHINFSPPAPETDIFCQGWADDNVVITMTTEDFSLEKNIYINTAGLIYVE